MSETFTSDSVVPIESRVLVRWARKPEKTQGGVLLPDQARSISQTAEVVQVAEGVTSVKRGDVVIFSSYMATPCVAVVGEEMELAFVRDKDILARVVVEDTDELHAAAMRESGVAYVYLGKAARVQP